jgi:23S rRNA (uracil1939-C5)-methyltransferase
MESAPACPVVETCGGCPLLRHSADTERALKLEKLHQLQAKLAMPSGSVELVSGAARIGYRNRIRLRIDDSGKIAFFNPEKSLGCAVLLPALQKYVSALCDWSNSGQTILAEFEHLEARAPDCDGYYGLYFTRKSLTPVSTMALAEVSKAYERQRVATSSDARMARQRFDIDGSAFQYVPLDGFLQVNFEVNRHLTQHIATGTRARNLRSFADLYCGSGNFALPLAAAGLRGIGIERMASCRLAAADAARNQQLTDVHFIDGDSVQQAARLLEDGQQFELVVLDPPRAGIREGLNVVRALATRNIVYCSCNPESMTRDLLALQQAGWRIEQLTGFDMFPGTNHLEVVAWLEM